MNDATRHYHYYGEYMMDFYVSAYSGAFARPRLWKQVEKKGWFRTRKVWVKVYEGRTTFALDYKQIYPDALKQTFTSLIAAYEKYASAWSKATPTGEEGGGDGTN